MERERSLSSGAPCFPEPRAATACAANAISLPCHDATKNLSFRFAFRTVVRISNKPVQTPHAVEFQGEDRMARATTSKATATSAGTAPEKMAKGDSDDDRAALARRPEHIGRMKVGRPQNGAEYLESLRDGRVVFIYGERVADVTTHPAFRNTARMAA
jgi:hypothetical protein